MVQEPSPGGKPRALFAGLSTLDIVQVVARMPGPNEKTTALRQSVSAGGPAANASVTFACLGGQATLVTGIGRHPLADGVHADLTRAGVTVIDAGTGDDLPPPVSSVTITEQSGDRSVVSSNAVGRRIHPPTNLAALVDEAQAVLIDGHHPALALAAAQAASISGRPCVLDGGSWKDNTADLLPYIHMAVCSADFRPPGTTDPASVLDFLADEGIGWAAVTGGPSPVSWAGPRTRGEIPVPTVRVSDTLGAGDIFHGAFLHAIVQRSVLNHGALDDRAITEDSFTAALGFAAGVASYSCQYFGTRTWTTNWQARR
jgi:sugar/nucleoside kinase (ribokinase family)